MTTQYLGMPAYCPDLASNPQRSLGPAQTWRQATPGTDFSYTDPNGNTVAGYARWIYIGSTGGNLDYIDWNGNAVTSFPVAQYSMFFMEATRISSSTTATGIWWSS